MKGHVDKEQAAFESRLTDDSNRVTTVIMKMKLFVMLAG